MMMTLNEAQKKLNSMQSRAEKNGRIRCRICGTDCYMEALDGNMFRFTGTLMGDPSDNPAFARLNTVGAHAWTAREGGACSSWTAETTWDTTLHYLIQEGHLDM